MSIEHMKDCDTCKTPNECKGFGVCFEAKAIINQVRNKQVISN